MDELRRKFLHLFLCCRELAEKLENLAFQEVLDPL